MSLLNAPCHLSPGILSNRQSGQVLGLWLGQAPPTSQTSNLLKPQLAISLGQRRSSTGTTCSLKGVGSLSQLSFNHRGPFASHFLTTSLIKCLYAPSRIRQPRRRPTQSGIPPPRGSSPQGAGASQHEHQALRFPTPGGGSPGPPRVWIQGFRAKLSRREVGHFRTKKVTKSLLLKLEN